jgi:hypothetical protein
MNAFCGSWEGEKHLFLGEGPEPDHRCPSTLQLDSVAEGRFLRASYTWSHGGKSHAGELLFGSGLENTSATGAWVDSWHQSSRLMFLEGEAGATEGIDLLGSYEAPSGPNWGWRIQLRQSGPDALVLLMYNLSPEGTEQLAVRATYSRSAA